MLLEKKALIFRLINSTIPPAAFQLYLSLSGRTRRSCDRNNAHNPRPTSTRPFLRLRERQGKTPSTLLELRRVQPINLLPDQHPAVRPTEPPERSSSRYFDFKRSSRPVDLRLPSAKHERTWRGTLMNAFALAEETIRKQRRLLTASRSKVNQVKTSYNQNIVD